jgi:plastocyanin
VPTCIDGVENGTESDIDCGGGCPGCMAGKDCLAPEDCQSGICGGGKCTAPTCSDGVKNGTESDLDCGGTCPGCVVGKTCVFATDCESGLCKASLCVLLNGCAPTTAVDLTGLPATTITFGGGGNMYDPPCFKVSAGTAVTFSGNFSAHPLAGGEVIGSQDFPDPTSPFMPVTSGGPPKIFTLTTPGDYAFYCTTHFANGMYGAAFVVP